MDTTFEIDEEEYDSMQDALRSYRKANRIRLAKEEACDPKFFKYVRSNLVETKGSVTTGHGSVWGVHYDIHGEPDIIVVCRNHSTYGHLDLNDVYIRYGTRPWILGHKSMFEVRATLTVKEEIEDFYSSIEEWRAKHNNLVQVGDLELKNNEEIEKTSAAHPRRLRRDYPMFGPDMC